MRLPKLPLPKPYYRLEEVKVEVEVEDVVVDEVEGDHPEGDEAHIALRPLLPHMVPNHRRHKLQ